MNKKRKLHDRILEELVEQVRPMYNFIVKNVEYTLPHEQNLVGEVDLMGFVDGEVHLYEVKSNGRLEKAVEQLRRAKKVLNLPDATCFYYAGKNIVKV